MGMEWKHAKMQTERHKIEREYGVRFTELLRLPYFDCARFSVVDPMHNFLLGTIKVMITIWREKSLITDKDLEKSQSLVDKFRTPPDVGRQFIHSRSIQELDVNLFFSCLLPESHFLCWYTFVQACTLLCSRAISHANTLKLHALIVRFCKKFEELYGQNSCTPNLHLHCHLRECIIDYGPANAFWLFACERLNGVLGAVSTNHRSTEAQLMRKLNFCSSQQFRTSFRANTSRISFRANRGYRVS